MEPRREGIEVCRGWKCDKQADCQSVGRCLYVPSAEEARLARGRHGPCGFAPETVAVTQIVTKTPPDMRMQYALPIDSAARKTIPIATGVLDYFPAALAAVAELSRIGNDKHNPGEPLHWARGKSSDHADCIMRHLAERGTVDTDGLSHSVKVAWRALALLQEELEAKGAPLARGAR